MAGKLNVAGAARGLDGALGRVTVTSRTIYLALLTAAPSNTTTLSTMVEYTATGYARQACAMGAPTGTPQTSLNTAVLTFGPLTGANGAVPITHWALVSAASGTTGEVVAQGDLTATRTPGASDTVSVAIGAVAVTID